MIKTTSQLPILFPTKPSDSYILVGDALAVLQTLPSEICRMVVTSPPYWGLRDYNVENQLGAEDDVNEYVEKLVGVFSEVKRVLTDDGTVWLNLGDSYTSGGRKVRAPDKKNPARAMSYRAPTPEGLKPKDLIGVPWRVAFALQDDGWYLRSEIIWHKPNSLPESVKDRPTCAHETIFLLSKNEKYYYDYDAVKEKGVNGKLRNKRTIWSVPTEPFNGAHFATYPPKLIEPCILAGSKPGDFILDPFFGSGTTGIVAGYYKRNFIGIELNPDYVKLAESRLNDSGLIFNVIREKTSDHGR